jgi:hypothetical protein
MRDRSFLSKPQLDEKRLAEIEDTIRTMPPLETILDQSPENDAWLGRASAAIESWDRSQSPILRMLLNQIMSTSPVAANQALRQFTILLHQARHDLLVQMPGAGTAAIPRAMVFAYFDGVRKIIELAKQDLLFIDPYLDADFVSRFLPHVAGGATIRLLAREKLATLLPAVDAFGQQTGRKIEVRSAKGFHDRYLIIDGTSCYQSGASFKDGAKSAPTTLTQIIDAFAAMLKTYEDLWATAKVER